LSLREGTEWMLAQGEMNDRFAGAASYLLAFARVLGAYAHLKAAVATGGDGLRVRLARVYINRLLPLHSGLLAQAQAGADALYELTDEDFAA
jgi:acyl-CoA dehydrogenase